jgi:hypothetical protein
MAHLRPDRAHSHPSLRQGGRRVLAVPAFGAAANQLTSSDPLGIARPFIPSSPCRRYTRLRAEQIGFWTSRATRRAPRTTQTFPDLADQARISDVIQDSDFRTEIASRKKPYFSAVPPCVRRTLGDFATPHRFHPPSVKSLTSLIIMAYPKKTPAVQFHVDCTPEAKSRFAILHEAFGFKTKAATFEAVLFAVSIKDKIDPQILLRLEAKLDRVLENFDSL